ncbi:hypothetical protein C2E23DRAFT_843595, partial [Lenzites betulinus]
MDAYGYADFHHCRCHSNCGHELRPRVPKHWAAVQTGTAAAGVSEDAQSDVHLSGAVTEDDTIPKALDLSALTRNSYIILGLLVAALVMHPVVAVLLAKSSRGNTVYRAVPSGNLARGTKRFASESESFYSTLYEL